MKDTKTTSRTSLLNLMLLKAWRERWSDAKWGINIKTVLPRGVSGDVYNLADCILQQAVIGSNANLLALSYLKHSLCAHLISHAAVLKRISKYEDFDKVYCVTALLDFLNSIMDGVTCRGKPEESVLPSAIVSLVLWLMQIISATLEMRETNNDLSSEEKEMYTKTVEIIEKIAKNDFLLGILYIGKQEDMEIYDKIKNKHEAIKIYLKNSEFPPLQIQQLERYLNQLASIDVEQLDMVRLNSKDTETLTFCVQPMFSVAVLLNPTIETQLYVSQMLMVQRLKGFSYPRLYYEIFRAGFISLSNSDASHDAIWCAFTFVKIPHILKNIHSKKEGTSSHNLDHIPDVIEALEMILEDSSILDFIDTKCERNFMESLLKEWAKRQIVTEDHIQIYAAKREPVSIIFTKRDSNVQAKSVINFVPCVEVPLSGLLKTLSTDYNKVNEALLGVLCQVLMGNIFDLILALATVEEKLKTFVSRLIKCNENSKQVPNETGKLALTRYLLFDVSFSMLTFIVQTYGSDIVLSENGDSFFETWVRECMVERNRMKSPKNMVALCDETVVDELLMTLNKQDGELKNCASWQEICMNIPGVLYQVLVAWENETLSSTDVKRILETIKRGPFSFSICAASYLCTYMQTVREDEFLKPINMVQQFISNSNPNPEEISVQHEEHIKERLALTVQIIRKMQNDVHPTGMNITQNIVSHSPLEEKFRDVWKNIADRGWLPIKFGQILESMLQACGPVWLVNRLVEEILKCKYTRDMLKIMDIVFAIMHLDIERTTIALLDNVIPTFLVGKQVEPQSSTLARLCVYCIISNLEQPHISSTRKRARPDDMDVDGETSNSSKLRKINADNSGDSCSNDFNADQLNNSNGSNTSNKEQNNIKEPLQTSLQNIFKMFAQFVTSDEFSPKIYFIFQFISLLVECGKDRIKPILKLLPNNLVQNLLKVMATDEIKVGLICRLYDLRSAPGRQSAISDLCLLRNIRMRKESINL